MTDLGQPLLGQLVSVPCVSYLPSGLEGELRLVLLMLVVEAQDKKLQSASSFPASPVSLPLKFYWPEQYTWMSSKPSGETGPALPLVGMSCQATLPRARYRKKRRIGAIASVYQGLYAKILCRFWKDDLKLSPISCYDPYPQDLKNLQYTLTLEFQDHVFNILMSLKPGIGPRTLQVLNKYLLNEWMSEWMNGWINAFCFLALC